jgi:FkbM family methyltransferase
MAAAQERIRNLIDSGTKNFEIDWENLLRLNYCVLLDEGSCIVDVGGNYGAHTECFIKDIRASRIAIFEPIPNLYSRLSDRFGSVSGVTLYQCALSNTSGTANFYWKSNADAESGLAKKDIYSDGGDEDIIEINVGVRTLDSVDLGFKPRYIKIDIEGGEIDMLRGSRETINRSRPIISLEYGSIGYEAFGHKAESVVHLKNEFGYALFDLFGNVYHDDEEFLSCVNTYYWDYIMIPGEQIPWLRDRIAIIQRLSRMLPMAAWRNTNLDIINRV